MAQKKVSHPQLRARIEKLSTAFGLISEGVELVTEESNSPMPGRAATGLTELLRWAARELEEMAKDLPKSGGQ